MAVKKTDLEISVSEKKLVLTEAKEKLRNEMHKGKSSQVRSWSYISIKG